MADIYDKVVLDYETRSKCDIKKCGPWVYAADPSTEILCAAYETACWSINDLDKLQMFLYLNPKMFTGAALRSIREATGVHVCVRDDIDHLIHTLNLCDVIEAHNAEFERAITKHVLGYDIPIEKLHDTAARASAMGLPRKLEKVAEVLKLVNTKDMKGHAKMLRASRPRKPTKNNPAEWDERDEVLIPTALYCVQDVRTESELSGKLFELSPMERKVWEADQRINERGVCVDKASAVMLSKLADDVRADRDSEIGEITGGKVKSCGQVKEITTYLNTDLGYGIVTDLRAVSVEEYQVSINPNTDNGKTAQRILTLRASASKTSVKKLDAIVNGTNDDGRMRACMMYHGADTGRWAGKRFQPQNLQRDSFLPDRLETFLSIVRQNSVEELMAYAEMVGVDVMDDIARCTRGMIVAGPGKEQIAVDYSSIEGRVLAWLAGEERILQAYRNGTDTYKLAAGDIFDVTVEEVTKDQRQIGKTVELACGYQGWVNAFTVMAETYHIEPLPEDRVVEIISAWRKARPKTRALWINLEKAAIRAIERPATMVQYRQVRMMLLPEGHPRNPSGQPILIVKLPSGRLLTYFRPGIVDVIRFGKPHKAIHYWGVDSTTHQWKCIDTYGGRLTENVVQAIARDLLAESIVKLEQRGDMPVVFHVHDEIVSEVDFEPSRSDEKLQTLIDVMTDLPVWADGLPIAATGWHGYRYRKD